MLVENLLPRMFALQLVVLFLLPAWGSIAAAEETAADSLIVEPDAGIVVVMDTTSVVMSTDSLGTPEAHPQDSPINRGFLIITPDGENQLRIRGSIRVTGAYDLQGLQAQDNFDTYEIPVGQTTTDGRFFLNASQTRLGVEARTSTEIGQAFMRVEGDFLGPEGSGSFRLRHAYGTLAEFTVGQTWTAFSDVSALPPTVDFEGPNSSITTRTVQVRYTPEKRRFALSIESPQPDVNLPDSLTSFQSFPDFAARLRLQRMWGHMQVAAIIRSITVRQDGEAAIKVGAGALFTGRMDLSPYNRLYWSFVGGAGISRFIAALSGRGLDVLYNPSTGSVEVVGSFGGYLTYGNDWSEDWYSNVSVGLIRVRNKPFEPQDAFRSSAYASANLFWNLTSGSRLGLEYTYGIRENKNLQTGHASRVSGIMYYDF